MSTGEDRSAGRPSAEQFSKLVGDHVVRSVSGDQLPPLSPEASEEFLSCVNHYIEELMHEAARNAHRRTRGEVVTAEDVEFASRSIAAGLRARTDAWMGVGGGLLAGGGIGNGLALLGGQGVNSTVGVVVTVLALVAGSVLTAWDLASRRAG